MWHNPGNPCATHCRKPPRESAIINRLSSEKSPYLLQHANNPVHWQPWDQEAFDRARELDRPVFLSVGYSTCHWCHVMAHESFEDPETAALLNKHFVNVKVDREERPDIDTVYMAACQAMTGQGGWPLTIVMTPDKRPFFTATYLPRDSRFGRMGLMDLVPRIGDMWRTRRDDLLAAAESIVARVTQTVTPPPPSSEHVDLSCLTRCMQSLADRFDAPFGGFGPAPKFPSPHNLMFLLRRHRRTKESRTLAMVEKTLMAMRHGGMFDHVGFGFHRYATDRVWLVPHFEKMLYDQALLALAYAETFQATRKPLYRQVAEEIVEYVLRDLAHPDGAFLSGQDADSEGAEGKFYVFTLDEVQTLLKDEADLAAEVFDLLPEGNYEDEATREKTGANILHLKAPLDVLAHELDMDVTELSRRVEAIRQRLYKARAQRPRPHTDDKVLTDWNGLMIAALAVCARAFARPDLAKAADRAVDCVLARLRPEPGRLLHRYRDGDAAIAAMLDDYAFLIWGLLELHQATQRPERLALALELQHEQLELFEDAAGGFFLTAVTAEELLFRPKDAFDGAIPSGNSVSLLNLVRLGRILGQRDLEGAGQRLLDAFAAQVCAHPEAFAFLLSAADLALTPGVEVVVVPGEHEKPGTHALLEALDAAFLPHVSVLLRTEGMEDLVPELRGLPEPERTSLAHVCRGLVCADSVDNPESLRELLDL